MRSSSRLAPRPAGAGDLCQLIPRRRSARLGAKPRMEELDQGCGELGWRLSVDPHVVLRVGAAGLAQIARDGAQKGDVAPGEAGIDHQRVVAVVLGEAVPDRHEARRAARPRRSRSSARPGSSVMSCSRIRGCPLAGARVGALVDDPKAHVLEHRYARGECDRVFAGGRAGAPIRRRPHRWTGGIGPRSAAPRCRRSKRSMSASAASGGKSSLIGGREGAAVSLPEKHGTGPDRAVPAALPRGRRSSADDRLDRCLERPPGSDPGSGRRRGR